MFSPHDVEVESLMAVSRCRTGLDSRLGYGKERPTQKNGRPVHPTPLSSTGRFRNIEVNRRQRGARAHRHTRSGNTTVSCREFQVRTAKDLEWEREKFQGPRKNRGKGGIRPNQRNKGPHFRDPNYTKGPTPFCVLTLQLFPEKKRKWHEERREIKRDGKRRRKRRRKRRKRTDLSQGLYNPDGVKTRFGLSLLSSVTFSSFEVILKLSSRFVAEEG